MIPILYGKSETAFTSNGLGRLTDCISCLVTEERNGIFECEFQYPVTGKLYNEMVTNGGIISVTHDDAKDRQPFDIYKYSAPINGIVTFNARHISYRLSGIVVKPYTAASCALALNGIVTNSVSANPFTFWTDKAVTTTFKLETPTSAKALLVGQQGSILDVYGKGEYKFDKFEVKLYTNRGTNSGVTIRYGKNLSDTLVENDSGEYYNAIVPYWKGQDGTLVTLTGWYVVQTGETLKYCIPVDFSSEFETQPTELELQTKAAAYLANNTPWLPKENVKVDFVQLWNTDEYKDVAVLERVKLCDTVAIYYPALGLTNSSAKVIKVVYDTLLERYSSIELGEPQQTLAEAIIQPYAQAIASISDKASVSFMEEAIQAATDLIAGGLGGHVVINRNADGEPEEILIMDTDNTSTAVNVWRWNLNGLAHSHSGYNGPFDDIAITQDGKINASMITTGVINANLITAGVINADLITSGTLSADRISGGTLTVGGLNNANGKLYVLDENGVKIGEINNAGLYIYGYGTESVVLRLGSFQNGGAYIYAYDGNGKNTVDINGNYGYVNLKDANGVSRVKLFGDPGFLGVGDGTQDRFRVFASTGQTSWYDENGNPRILFDSRSSYDYAQFLSELRPQGGMKVINGLTADNATVTGVLDVTQRRCYATLSSAGWYRVITIAGSGGGIDSWIANICITRGYYLSRNETHSISLLACDGSFSFVDEISKSNTQGISDIRYVRDGSYGYIDIYYSLLNENDVCVTFDVKTIPTRQDNFVSADFSSVAPTPSIGSVVAQHSFFPTTGSKITFSPSVGTSFNDYGGCYYMIQNGICFVHVGLSGLSANTSQIVFTLPARVRPQSLIASCGIGGASITAISRGWIYEDGRIIIVPDDQYTAIDFSYVI